MWFACLCVSLVRVLRPPFWWLQLCFGELLLQLLYDEWEVRPIVRIDGPTRADQSSEGGRTIGGDGQTVALIQHGDADLGGTLAGIGNTTTGDLPLKQKTQKHIHKGKRSNTSNHIQTRFVMLVD